MTRAVWVGGALALGACFSKPPPNVAPDDAAHDASDDAGQDAGPSDAAFDACPVAPPTGMSVVGQTIAWPSGMRLRFASPPALELPAAWELSTCGPPLIAPSLGCGVEDGVGIAVFPAHHVSAQTNQNLLRESQTTWTRGTAYAEVSTYWIADLTIDCNNESVEAVVTFGMFPDGRIVRVDTVTLPTIGAVGMCSTCGSGDTFYVTSYAALSRSGLLAAHVPPDPPGPLPMSGATIEDRDAACVLDTAGNRVAIVWDRFSGGVDSRLRSLPNALALVYDLHVATMLAGEQRGLRTTYVTSVTPTTCAALIQRAREVNAAPGALTVTGMSSTPAPAEPTGVYRYTGIETGTLVVRTTAAVPPGFVISFPSTGTFSTSLTAGSYEISIANSRLFLWSRDGLAAGSSFTVTL